MIEIKRQNGMILIKAFTIAEVIAQLSEFDRDLPVVFVWEGQRVSFDADRIALGKVREVLPFGGRVIQEVTVLELCADDY